MTKKKLRVGTDCSGIEAPIQALKNLKIPFSHEFSSDIDKHVIKSIKANYKPKRLYGDPDGKYPNGDITERNHKELPDIDLYVCGFPCQSFSMAGKRLGALDRRGLVFWSCVDVIKIKQPNYFILENVKGLLTANEGITWEFMEKELKKLNRKPYKYNIYWNVLNTKDYGIPQNRERLFIVGIKDDVDKGFEWPKPVPMLDLNDFVDWNDISREDKTFILEKYYHNINENDIFVDKNFLKFRKFKNANKYSPCLNTLQGLWCVPLHRKGNVKEYLKLQGFPKTFKQTVNQRQFIKEIGNSMSVNVLDHLLKQIM